MDWVQNKKFDGSNIVAFANKIKSDYSHMLPEGNPEIEFGPGDTAGGALLGGLGGVLIGGAIAGPGGAVLGGLTGATLGGIAGSPRYHSRIRDYSRSDASYL
jgi:hypothetical protein